MSEEKLGRGRPTKYKEEYNELARKFCLMGATDDKLAEFFEVDVSTINLWKLEHQDFSESIRKGKGKADAEIANSLYHRAKGYAHEDTDIKMYLGDIVKTKTTKHYPPDTAACIIWLKNRQKGTWRDKQEIEHTGETHINLTREVVKVETPVD
jgi:hypothetical protein